MFIIIKFVINNAQAPHLSVPLLITVLENVTFLARVSIARVFCVFFCFAF